MNIRKLNEQIEKVLNETSADLQTKVLALRKEQADRAKYKYNKTLNRMAKKDIGKPSEINITFKGYYCTTEEDNYEEGALPYSYGTEWDFDGSKTFTLELNSETICHDIMKMAKDFTNIYWADDYCGVWEDDNKITFAVQGNNDNEKPTKEEWEDFKAGDINLWIIDVNIPFEIDEYDKPYFIECCKKAQHIDMY